jgi:hypothetical protein
VSTSSSGGGGGGGGATGSGTVTANAGAGGGVSLTPTAITNGTAGSVATASVNPTGGAGGSGGAAGGGGTSATTSVVSVGGTYGGGGGAVQNSASGSTGAGKGSSGAVRIIWPASKAQDGSTVRAFGVNTGALTLVSNQSGTLADVQNNISYTVSIPTSGISNLNINNTWTSQLWEGDLLPQANVFPITNPTTPRDLLYYATLVRGKYGQTFPIQLPTGIPGADYKFDPNTLSNFDSSLWKYF